jgi:lysine-specific metallo-endopeptidase family protein
MKGLIGVGVIVLGLQVVQAEPGEARRSDAEVFHVRLRHSRDGFLVGQALRGAHRRLAQPGCQAVFSDFTESSGRRLQDVLDERGETGQSHLQRLFFYDGADARECTDPGVLAFTQPGSHVVYVCNQWFREAFATNPSKVEAVIIHESLHSLGLGENPPRSQDITARVMERCVL